MSLTTFAVEAISNMQTTASLVPSSRYLARAMLRSLPMRKVRNAVEFGPGTGVLTRHLLSELPADASLFSIEINPRFSSYLRKSIQDPRLVLANDSAENLESLLRRHEVAKADAVVSSLGLTFMPEPVRVRIFERLLNCIDDDTVLTQFQYLHGHVFSSRIKSERLPLFSTERFLRRYFGSVTQRPVWRNFPPAVVFTCRR